MVPTVEFEFIFESMKYSKNDFSTDLLTVLEDVRTWDVCRTYRKKNLNAYETLERFRNTYIFSIIR